MARVKGKVRRATKRGIDKIETRILVHEGKKSVRAKVATVKRVAKPLQGKTENRMKRRLTYKIAVVSKAKP